MKHQQQQQRAEWTLRLQGAWHKTAEVARAIGGPRWFKPAAIIPMPMTVVHDGLRDAHVWRVRHWGIYQEPVRVFWSRDPDGAYRMDAVGGEGVPVSLFKHASALWPDVTFTLEWNGPNGATSQCWHNGASIDAINQKEKEFA